MKYDVLLIIVLVVLSVPYMAGYFYVRERVREGTPESVFVLFTWFWPFYERYYEPSAASACRLGRILFSILMVGSFVTAILRCIS